LAVVAGMKKPNDHAEPTKSRTLKKQNKNMWSLQSIEFLINCLFSLDLPMMHDK